MHWEFDSSGLDDVHTGEPKDLVKIGYSSDHFSKPSHLDGDSWYEFGGTTSLAGNDALSGGGIVGKYNGLYFDPNWNPLVGDGEFGGDLDLSDYMLVHVDPNLSVGYDELTIYFSYSMLYDNAELDGTSVSTDKGITIGIANESDSWTVAVAYEASDLIMGKSYSRN